MPREDFALAYDGPAVTDGRMPVRELAPALLALGELFHLANEIAQPESPPVHLEVRAFNDGSFKAALTVATIDDMIDLLNTEGAIALATLITLISDPGQGVFAALRKVRGKIRRRIPEPDGETTKIETESGDVYYFPNSTINVLSNEAARDAALTAMRPLEEEGVEEMRIEREGDDPLVIRKDEVADVEENWEEDEGDDAEDPAVDEEFDALITITQLAFDPKYMWRVQFGDNLIRAKLADARFLNKIHRREVGFFDGDTLKVRLRMRQWAGKKTEFTIVKVVSHRHRGNDTPLPFENDAD